MDARLCLCVCVCVRACVRAGVVGCVGGCVGDARAPERPLANLVLVVDSYNEPPWVCTVILAPSVPVVAMTRVSGCGVSGRKADFDVASVARVDLCNPCVQHATGMGLCS